MHRFEVPDERAMMRLGHSWADKIINGSVVFFSGQLGSGKTTLIKGLLSGFGFEGIVTSPTYTLVETYTLNQRLVYHFDLYRLESPEELEIIGVRDMITANSISLIEWPERGSGVLPAADYEIDIQYQNSGQSGRNVSFISHNSV